MPSDKLDLSSRICTDCGQEFPCGLRATADHIDTCPRNAPNTNIESHHYQVEQQARETEHQRINSILEAKMTPQELQTFTTYSYSGTILPQQNVILMGKYALNRYNTFRNKMAKKYLPKEYSKSTK